MLLWAGREPAGAWAGQSPVLPQAGRFSPPVSRQDCTTHLSPWGVPVLGSRMLCASAPAYPAKKQKKKNLEKHKQEGINVLV